MNKRGFASPSTFQLIPLRKEGARAARTARLPLCCENDVALPFGRSLREVGAEMGAPALFAKQGRLGHQAPGEHEVP